ncbi:AAA family ATPase, partial [Persephonella sp.]
MYLSRLIISNYRSIKFLDLAFSPTKNVIIGHNNAGKSNIIKALNIILGEQTPDYKKYENITERDFFNGAENELFIIGEISKKEDSKIDFELLKKTSSGSSITLKNSLKDFFEKDNFDDFIEETFNINFEDISLGWASSIS